MSAKIQVKKMERFDAHLPNLLKEMAKNDACSTMRIPVNITLQILSELAEYAIEKDDPQLHVFMLRLGLYEVSAADRVKKIKRLEREIEKTKGGEK